MARVAALVGLVVVEIAVATFGDLPAGASAPDNVVRTETQLRRAWADPLRTRIDLGSDIALRDCATGDPIRESPYPLRLEGHGHTIRQTCFEKRVLRQDGTGWLDLRDVALTRGGADGPGAAVTSRGEIMLRDCVVQQNLAEEPGGGVFSMRRVTAHRCRITGNLANDDGGGIYARRGGVQVYDSVLSTNLVDGSGGAIGSTGDVLVVDSWVDGNTTDGDGGAIYTDEDGDVTVVRSLIDGSDADGPGGGIFALDGDVAVLDSTLIGNRADDRGGAISGEADVLVVNSTVARNLAVAHAGGGIWARGDLTLVNSTVTNNYAEGEGGGALAAGETHLLFSTVLRNIASIAGDVGSSGPFTSFGSIIGPPAFEGVTGDTIPTRRSCRVYAATSAGYNFIADPSCELLGPTDVLGADPEVAQLEDDPKGFVLEPLDGSPVRARIPSVACRGSLPDPLPAGQLLESWVDWGVVLTHDAVDRPRDTGAACDIGAVQSAPLVSRRGLQVPSVPDRLDQAPPALAVAEPVVRDDTRRPGERRSVAQLVRALDRQSRRFVLLRSCLSALDVDRAGDPHHRWGFLYDERDGTGLDRRPALVPHRGHDAPQWRLLTLDRGRRCLGAPPDPNGSGADARRAPFPQDARTLRDLVERVQRRVDRFDAWESCLTWLPVTEAGQSWRPHGYRSHRAGGPAYVPAVDVDRGEWDDPDYQVLVMRGGRRRCADDPGEGDDRRAALRSRPGSALEEVVEDLVEPVEEIVRFDECLYTVGMAARPGYLFRGPDGRRHERRALSFDLHGPHRPALDVLAFPGEEPPQIECNEDAGGIKTHE